MPVVGLLYDARPDGGNSCNGHIAPVHAVGHYANLAECLHVDDLMALVAKAGDAPDTSKV